MDANVFAAGRAVQDHGLRESERGDATGDEVELLHRMWADGTDFRWTRDTAPAALAV